MDMLEIVEKYIQRPVEYVYIHSLGDSGFFVLTSIVFMVLVFGVSPVRRRFVRGGGMPYLRAVFLVFGTLLLMRAVGAWLFMGVGAAEGALVALGAMVGALVCGVGERGRDAGRAVDHADSAK
ncbi:hypothetical protein ACFFOP_06025 [Sinosporangium siamense]